MDENFMNFIETSLQQLQTHKQIAVECGVNDEMIQLHDDFIGCCEQIKVIAKNTKLADNYINLFQNDVNQALDLLQYKGQQNLLFIQPHSKEHIKNSIENFQVRFNEQVQKMQFNLDFFQKLNFFNKNIVAIGANGSGKTALSNNLKKYLPKMGVVIAAQKVLIIPTFSGISNPNQTNEELKATQNIDKSLRTTFSTGQSSSWFSVVTKPVHEFGILLDNLLAENSSTIIRYNKTLCNGMTVKDKPITTLDKVLSIWNSLIQHRILECNDGINLTLKAVETSPYPAHQMSDGEKVALYLIAQVLQAPQNGFVIADEPEMYLHKTILKKLWDRLEQERQDCIFVYLTHDLDFATSRNAKKVWIKSYRHPDKWEIEDIPENELPEALLLELLGSRKPILFCEGIKGSLDEKIYNCLFPEYTVTPVKGCFAVINYTKTFNKIPNITTKAFGLIDSDHHCVERLTTLKQDNIFSLSIAEIENLLLQEDFLKLLAPQLMVGEKEIDNIKNEVINQLEKDIDLQVSNYVSAKIDYYFKDSNVTKGNTQKEVEDNYQKFASEINIPDWYLQRKLELEKVIGDKDYSKVLTVYNNKGLRKIINKNFKIYDFPDRAIKFLQSNKEAQKVIKQSFPQEITESQNATN